MTRTMYDAVNWAAIPADAAMVGGYVDGPFAWPAEGWARFPHARHVGISRYAQLNNGHALDVEPGASWPPEDAPGWVLRRRAAGADPSVYMNQSTWARVFAAFHDQGVAHPWYWVASYPGMGPVVPPGAVAHQYADPPGSGGDYDLSVVLDHWPGVDPLPVPPVPKYGGKRVFLFALPNGSLYSSDLITFRWLNGADELAAAEWLISSVAGNAQLNHVGRWQQMGVPADVVSARAANADPANPCPWPAAAG